MAESFDSNEDSPNPFAATAASESKASRHSVAERFGRVLAFLGSVIIVIGFLFLLFDSIRDPRERMKKRPKTTTEKVEAADD